ncbi:glycosyltransferase [Kingella negevensis]|uniref:Uncharacterized protein n=1 Tax=Kingella negevensis TaxID=1522312 RepID=A0A238TBQ2_9NEIS|nr:glycosyltransferase [Kingella negevensis]MDK4680906.1 glycosyltransferase [Kingella negevensis]MDK4683108.1 glycosyltransferase [Kingella negevensis]MDK4684009.1 glycosyltransferase [Kingella negevensis]MDK4691759.1 glycosyltransferase [Kingella negevensis]MDK4693088.1 glycosyltransferase [Kingella negevensis]
MTQLIKFIIATRSSAKDFSTQTATGRNYYQFLLPLSLNPFQQDYRLELDVQFNNTQGLPTVYNQAIERYAQRQDADPSTIFIFLHDDIIITDFYWHKALIQSLEKFDIIGLAGCKTRAPYQIGWLHTWQPENNTIAFNKIPNNLSGIVSHGTHFPSQVNFYGEPDQEVKLLDGLLLATQFSTL